MHRSRGHSSVQIESIYAQGSLRLDLPQKSPPFHHGWTSHPLLVVSVSTRSERHCQDQWKTCLMRILSLVTRCHKHRSVQCATPSTLRCQKSVSRAHDFRACCQSKSARWREDCSFWARSLKSPGLAHCQRRQDVTMLTSLAALDAIAE
jgi:hypothetical protein